MRRKPMRSYAELADVVIGAPVAGSAEAKTAALVAALRQLIDDVALPATLAAGGCKASDLEMLATDAMLQQRLLVNNPRDVTYDDALAIYQAAYGAVCMSKAAPSHAGGLQDFLSDHHALVGQ